MDWRVRKVVAFLQQSWRRPVRIEELAQFVGLGASRLEHLFKEQARTSIRDYIREQRLEAAASLLVNTAERISAISYQVGFPDVPNFNHAFKRRFGISPREYRERHHRHGAEDTNS
jgi:AraC family transcriptional regulator of arabinose operon